MSPFEYVGLFYSLFAIAAFTVALARVAWLGLMELSRRYHRGKNAEEQDLVDAYRVRHTIEQAD